MVVVVGVAVVSVLVELDVVLGAVVVVVAGSVVVAGGVTVDVAGSVAGGAGGVTGALGGVTEGVVVGPGCVTTGVTPVVVGGTTGAVTVGATELLATAVVVPSEPHAATVAGSNKASRREPPRMLTLTERSVLTWTPP